MADQADLIERARAKGWPDGLLARVQAIWPAPEVAALLSSGAPQLAVVERELDVRERTRNGPFRIRELNARDIRAFAELWAHAPERLGEWSVTVERSPNSIAQFLLHEDCSITVLEEADALYACVAWSRRNVQIAGTPTSILIAHAMRVHESRRGQRLADLVRRYPSRALSARPTIGQYMYVRTGNANVIGFFDTVAKQTFGEIGAAGIKAVITHFPPREGAPDAAVRRATRDDLAACAALINRTHGAFDLFAPYTAENLAARLGQGYTNGPPPVWPHVYGWPDFHVLEESGAIVACGGLWDRGRDMREVWTHKDGETHTVSATNLLDFGYAEGCEDAMARLITHYIGVTASLGRTALIAPLDRLPALAAACAEFEPRLEERTFEWTPFIPDAPKVIAEPYNDLRFW